MADQHDHGDIPTDPIEFREAIAALLDRVPMTRELFDELDAAEQEFAFTVANVTQADVVAQAYEAIQAAVRDGTDFETFKADVGQQLEDSWGGEIPGRLENVFRTNVQTAYNAGRYRLQTAPATKQARPYWRLNGIIDARTTKDICLPLLKAKLCLPADHTYWRTHYPPLHYQCRDTVDALTEAEAQRYGITRHPPDVSPLAGFGRAPSVGGADWQPDTADYPAPIASELDDRLG